MENITINKQMGLKWFNFFTKVRPFVHFIACLFIVIEVSMDPQLYLGSFFMLIYVLGTIVQCVLVEISSIKAREENYGDFVAFVKKSLIYEIVFVAYANGIDYYYNYGLIYALIIALNVLVVYYFLWYRLNVKYFEKRMVVEGPAKTRKTETKAEEQDLDDEYDDEYDDDDYDSDDDLSDTSARCCYVCGLELDEDDVFCERCGTRVDESDVR